jgi:hypothetical protein
MMKDIELKEGYDYKRTETPVEPEEVEVLVGGDKYILIRIPDKERTEIALHGVSIADMIVARAFLGKAIEEEVKKGLVHVVEKMNGELGRKDGVGA